MCFEKYLLEANFCLVGNPQKLYHSNKIPIKFLCLKISVTIIFSTKNSNYTIEDPLTIASLLFVH